MNDCMWAVFYLCEEGETFKRTDDLESVQARLKDFINVAA